MSKSIKNSSLYLFQIAISGVLMLILMPIISKYLLPNELGVFVLTQVYASIAVGVANLGMLVGYERNFFIFEKSGGESAKLISSAVLFVTFNLLALLVLVYLFQREISDLIFTAEVPSNLLVMVLIGASTSSLSQYYLTFLKNSSMARSYIKYMIVNSIIYFMIAILLMTLAELGPMALAYAWASSNTVLFFSLFLILKKALPIGFDMGMFRQMLKISLPLTPRVFFGFLNTQFDKILLGMIGSNSLVGVYHMGQTFAMTIFQFMTGLSRVFQPEIYRKLFAGTHAKNSNEINQYLLPFFYVSIFMALIVVLFSREFVSIFLSHEYQDATIIIIILSIYYVSMFFGKVTGTQLIYAKKTYITTLLMFAGITINVGLNIPFIIKWGVVGAAWATTISGVIMTIAGYVVAQRYVKITWEWKPILVIYSMFLIAVALSLVDYSFPMYLHVFLLLKFMCILIYIITGYVSNLMSIRKIRELLFIKDK